MVPGKYSDRLQTWQMFAKCLGTVELPHCYCVYVSSIKSLSLYSLMECIPPAHLQTWVHDPPLPENAPVRSVLNPGEEVVVLVKGFNPALAFPSPRTQRSVCLPPPNRRKGASHESRDLRSKGSILRGMSDASIRPENALENIVENDPDSSAIARNTASAKRGKTAWGKKQTKKRSTETTGQAETSTSHSREDDMKEGTLFRSARRGQTSADETWYRGLFSNAMIRGAEVQQRLDVYPNNDDDDDDDDKNISHTHAVPLGAPTADTANDDDGEHRRARSTFEQTNNHPSAIGGKSLFQIDASSCDRKQHGAHKGFQQDRISNGIKARFRANDDDGDGYDEYGNDEDILTDEDESEEDRTIVSIPRPNNARPAARSAISISTDSSDSTRQREDSGTARGNGTVGGSIATSRRFSGNENVEQIRNTDRETEVEFSEPRSPPRSVISSIFAAWGNGRR